MIPDRGALPRLGKAFMRGDDAKVKPGAGGFAGAEGFGKRGHVAGMADGDKDLRRMTLAKARDSQGLRLVKATHCMGHQARKPGLQGKAHPGGTGVEGG